MLYAGDYDLCYDIDFLFDFYIVFSDMLIPCNIVLCVALPTKLFLECWSFYFYIDDENIYLLDHIF